MPSSAPAVAAELLTLPEVAKLCGVSQRTVWQWATDGTAPPALRIGKGVVRYSRAAYVAWVAAGCPRQTMKQGGVDADRQGGVGHG